MALTGYHRKHAIRVLNRFSEPGASGRRGRLRLSDEAVRQALIVFWVASDRVCGKRLKVLLPVLLPALERHGHISLDPALREHLLAVSASTIDRVLSGPRASAGRRRARPKTTPAVRRRIPVRTFADWHDPEPGFVEADLVVHCGESMAGSFASTLVLTDIASGWIECVALLVREGSLIVDALERLRMTLPFPLRGIDTDNGSESINELLILLSLAPVRELLSALVQLADKERVGAHIRKRYHAPETPCARLLAAPVVAESMKDRLRAILGTLDPLRLLEEIRTVQHHLAGLATGERVLVLPHRDADLDRFLKSLGNAWREGEVRPTNACDSSVRQISPQANCVPYNGR